jgi:hypothetical protein
VNELAISKGDTKAMSFLVALAIACDAQTAVSSLKLLLPYLDDH